MQQVVSNKNVINLYEGVKCVGLSGGLDSALLLYLIMNSGIKDHIHVFTHYNSYRLWPKSATENIVKWISEKTGFKNYTHHKIDTGVKEPSNEYIYNNGLSSIISKNHIQYYYKGTTEVIPEFTAICYLEKWAQRRLPNADKKQLEVKNGVYFYHPFININKFQIKDMYDAEGLDDSLINLTRSCVGYKSNEVNYACKQCYWCKERSHSNF